MLEKILDVYVPQQKVGNKMVSVLVFDGFQLRYMIYKGFYG